MPTSLSTMKRSPTDADVTDSEMGQGSPNCISNNFVRTKLIHGLLISIDGWFSFGLYSYSSKRRNAKP